MKPLPRIAEFEAELAIKDRRIAVVEEQNATLQEQSATLQEQVAALQEQLGGLTRQVAELSEKLNQNSRNSHKPPSSDGPGQRKARDKSGSGKRKRKSGRKRGAQPGHKGNHRELIPAEQVNDFIPAVSLNIEDCARCNCTPPDIAWFWVGQAMQDNERFAAMRATRALFRPAESWSGSRSPVPK